MRDQLSEILSTFRFTEQSGHPLSVEDARLQLADHLIKHGVLAPPCKVNDTVYTISRGKIKEWKVYYIGVNLRGEFHTRIADIPLNNSREVYEYELGVSVFLTEEDAINELKERKSYGQI